ncbi:MAG: rhodanese-like domain-containing protein [Thermodesulfobacteriota bacterium]|nr:rhodanese-like domain-containing protein [Thermodesulfobacteriota bacterium]
MKHLRNIMLTLISIGMALGYLSFTRPNINPKETTWDEMLIDAQKGGYKVVTTEQLRELYIDNKLEKPLLIDTRQDWEYRAGHIKGALNFSIEPTWYSMWLKREKLKAFLGPDRNRSIVFY